MPDNVSFQAKRNVFVLVLVQAISGAQMPMVFIVSGLAGQSLASNICWATLPISIIVFGSMTTAQWLSQVMQRYGRRFGFYCGNLGGLIGGALGFYALYQSSFLMFLLASYFTGIYMSANGFIRFAAADTASEEFRPKAISYVMAGGLLAAIIGPQLVKLTHDQLAIPFLGTFIAVIGVNVLGCLLVTFLDIPRTIASDKFDKNVRTYRQLLSNPRILVSIICAMVAYSLMNLVMTSTPLAVVGCGYTENNAADVVSSHVLAMFAPSFITGHIIAKYGAEKVVSAGLIILTCAGVVAISGIDLINFFAALILLGFGWNFAFIGSTSMLVSAHTPQERGKVQGLNDVCVFGCVTLASLASGIFMNCTSESIQTGWQYVNWAMVPFLLLAGGAIIWFSLTKPSKATS